ncbi:MAG: hypothetical protein Fur002_19850 [Anaerolineales bacterium]
MTTIEIPAELLDAAKLSPEEAKTELAIRLYQQHRLNLEQAKALAHNPQAIDQLAWAQAAADQLDMNEFLSWASHDLKSPLNTIIGFTRVVIKGMDGPVNEAQAGDLTTAFVNSQRLLALLNNVVDMARLSVGHIQPQPANADVNLLIKESTDKWKTANPEKPLAIESHLTQPAHKADANYFKQIIVHLLNYAAMRVTSGSLTLSAQDADGALRVRVQSSGEKTRDTFEMDATMMRFICGALIRLQGGALEDVQENADGVTLSFSLPLA